jgi:hypothetical protein
MIPPHAPSLRSKGVYAAKAYMKSERSGTGDTEHLSRTSRHACQPMLAALLFLIPLAILFARGRLRLLHAFKQLTCFQGRLESRPWSCQLSITAIYYC